MQLRNLVELDTQPVKRFKRYKGYAIYIRYKTWNVTSAREWDFTAEIVSSDCANAHLSGNTGLGHTPGRKSWRTTKCRTLLSLEVFFWLCFYFDRHQKGAHLYQRGAILTGRHRRLVGSCPKLPPWIGYWLPRWKIDTCGLCHR